MNCIELIKQNFDCILFSISIFSFGILSMFKKITKKDSFAILVILVAEVLFFDLKYQEYLFCVFLFGSIYIKFIKNINYIGIKKSIFLKSIICVLSLTLNVQNPFHVAIFLLAILLFLKNIHQNLVTIADKKDIISIIVSLFLLTSIFCLITNGMQNQAYIVLCILFFNNLSKNFNTKISPTQTNNTYFTIIVFLSFFAPICKTQLHQFIVLLLISFPFFAIFKKNKSTLHFFNLYILLIFITEEKYYFILAYVILSDYIVDKNYKNINDVFFKQTFLNPLCLFLCYHVLTIDINKSLATIYVVFVSISSFREFLFYDYFNKHRNRVVSGCN